VIYRHAALFSYVWRCGVQCQGVGGCPGESRFSHGVVACPVFEQGWPRGWKRGGCSGRLQAGSREPLTAIRTGYSGRRGGVPSPRAQQRRSCCSSARRDAAGRGWLHRTDNDGDGAPTGLTSRFDPAESREEGSRVRPAPLRGRGTLAVLEWAAQCHGADTGLAAQSPTVAGMGSP
jgi:hypothetical protein